MQYNEKCAGLGEKKRWRTVTFGNYVGMPMFLHYDQTVNWGIRKGNALNTERVKLPRVCKPWTEVDTSWSYIAYNFTGRFKSIQNWAHISCTVSTPQTPLNFRRHLSSEGNLVNIIALEIIIITVKSVRWVKKNKVPRRVNSTVCSNFVVPEISHPISKPVCPDLR